MLEDPYDFKPNPQSRFWGWTLIGWLFIVGLFGAAMTTCAMAAEVFRGLDREGGAIVLKLHDKPCTNEKVLAKLHDQLLDDRRFKAATLTYHGRDWASCWVDRRGNVLSMDEEGSPLQPVPRIMFKEETI